jgi:hypothetical protein
MQARGQTRLTANCLASEMWPDARHTNSHGQSFNLAAGIAGRMLRKYRACHEVEKRVWEIVPEFLPNTEISDESMPETPMARIKLPVPVREFADITEALSNRATADGRTAFMRQAGDCMEIYSLPK